jgi:hypothetical protein
MDPQHTLRQKKSRQGGPSYLPTCHTSIVAGNPSFREPLPMPVLVIWKFCLGARKWHLKIGQEVLWKDAPASNNDKTHTHLPFAPFQKHH